MAFDERDFPECVKPPRESQFYWPTQDYILVGARKNIERFIFKLQEFTEYELYKLEKLENFIRLKGLQGFTMPENFDRADLLRFLYGSGFVTKKAYNSFINHLKWRNSYLPEDYRLLLGRLRGLLEEGVFYIHGRDNRYRPCVIFDIMKVDLKRHTTDDYGYLLCFVLTYVIDVMMSPGKIESWVVISDFSRRGLLGLPTGAIKRIVTTLLENFRCRLALNYILNAPTSLTFMWPLVRALLDQRTASKITTLASSSSERMLSHFNPNQVEQKYGGAAPNLTVFWPPYCPPGPFNASGEAPHSLLTDYKDQETVESNHSPQEEYSDYSFKRASSPEPEMGEPNILKISEEPLTSGELYEPFVFKTLETFPEQLNYAIEDNEPKVTRPLQIARLKLNKAGIGVFVPKFEEPARRRPVQLLRVEDHSVTPPKLCGFYDKNCTCALF